MDVDELDDGAAHGAILVGFEPGVDAGNVKSVVTFGHNPEVILCLEEIQADGAFRRFPQQRLRFSVLADGDGVDDGGVEPDGAYVPDRVVHHEPAVDLAAAAAFLRRLRGGRRSPPVPPPRP